MGEDAVLRGADNGEERSGTAQGKAVTAREQSGRRIYRTGGARDSPDGWNGLQTLRCRSNLETF